jgi:undecaprenyl-diphosphatase
MFKSGLIGIVQGLTEFLPVSSSAHLVFSQNLLGWSEPDIFFDVMLHFATLLAVLIFFRKDIIDVLKNPRSIFLIILGTIPAGLIGLFARKYIVSFFSANIYPAVFLLITGFFLYLTQKISRGEKYMRKFSVPGVVLVGIAQSAALLPGISRSGITISTGMFLGWRKIDAVKFSFLLSIPAILGATIFELKEVSCAGINLPNVIAGCICAFISGLFALYLLLETVKKAKLHLFAYYCWFLGILILVVSGIK